jgi:hypothetical protein
MGRSRIKSAVIALSAAALVAAPGAFSATPQEIYRDYADNGRLDNAYTPADLERVLKNAAVQQYGPGTVGGGLKPEVEEEIDDTPTGGSSPGGTAGGSSPGGTAGGQTGGGTSPVQTTGGLPFTGLDLSLIAAGALGLILLGAALRRVARQKA